MKYLKPVLPIAIWAIAAATLLAGCQPPVRASPKAEKAYDPPPPPEPRQVDIKTDSNGCQYVVNSAGAKYSGAAIIPRMAPNGNQMCGGGTADQIQIYIDTNGCQYLEYDDAMTPRMRPDGTQECGQ